METTKSVRQISKELKAAYEEIRQGPAVETIRYSGGKSKLSHLCMCAAVLLDRTQEAQNLTLDEFRAQRRPCWIIHKKLKAYTGWAVYVDEQGPLVKIDYIRSGRVMITPETYGKDWQAFTDVPENIQVLWAD